MKTFAGLKAGTSWAGMLMVVFYPAFFLKHGTEFGGAEQILEILVGIAFLDESVEGGEMKTEVEVVDESLFAVSYVHESRVQGGQELLDSAEEDAAHRKTVTLVRFPVEFDQAMVLHQRDAHLRKAFFDDKVFFDFLFVHCVD